MNKSDLVSQIAKNAGITKTKADATFTALIDGIKGALNEGDKVTLIGFGTFSVNERKARIGRHPRTGKKIKIAASKAAKFKVGKELKEMLNK